MSKHIIIYLLCFVFFVGCKDQDNKAYLVNIKWVLSSYGFRGEEQIKPIKKINYYLEFTRYFNFVFGAVDCRYIQNKYVIQDDNKLYFISRDYYAYTSQQCPKSDGGKKYLLEHHFIKSVMMRSNIFNRYSIKGNKLTLISPDGKQLIFRRTENEHLIYFGPLFAEFGEYLTFLIINNLKFQRAFNSYLFGR